MKMKIFLFLLIAGLLAAPETRASPISITLSNPNQSGFPGGTLHFFGTIVNSGGSTVFLSSNTLTLSGTGFILTDLFFDNVPGSLAANSSLANIELFNLTLMDPFPDPSGLYVHTYTLTGNVDGYPEELLDQVNFSVSVPEPASSSLLIIGLIGLGAARHRYGSSRKPV